jgi:hypothetical protein
VAFVLFELAGGEFAKILGVLLVGEAVGGDVRGREGEGGLKVCLPLFEALAWDGKHEVDIERFESGGSEGVDGGAGLCAGVNAAEGFEGGVVPGLNAEADSVDARFFEESRFFGPDGSRVGFYGPFLEVVERQAFVESCEKIFELVGQEGGWGAASEIQGAGKDFAGLGLDFQLLKEGI